jgi:protein farnesyltransferase subunit beta
LLTCARRAQGGGFCMTEGGEADTRGCYTALAAARLAGLLSPALTAGVGDYLARCQTYEGGLGGEPFAEAHGGYTFCGLAAALLAGEAARLDLPRLLRWAAHRQGGPEGGFNGRTNKLVDGCYSLWQGGLFPLLQAQMPLLRSQMRAQAATPQAAAAATPPPVAPPVPPPHRLHACTLFPCAAADEGGDAAGAPDAAQPAPPLYSALALQGWLLACCQSADGGLRDKPGKPRDFYHTCYCLSGLSSAQHYGGGGGGGGGVGPPANTLAPADPLLNVAAARLVAWDELLKLTPVAC